MHSFNLIYFFKPLLTYRNIAGIPTDTTRIWKENMEMLTSQLNASIKLIATRTIRQIDSLEQLSTLSLSSISFLPKSNKSKEVRPKKRLVASDTS